MATPQMVAPRLPPPPLRDEPSSVIEKLFLLGGELLIAEGAGCMQVSQLLDLISDERPGLTTGRRIGGMLPPAGEAVPATAWAMALKVTAATCACWTAHVPLTRCWWTLPSGNT
jgi:hypothetical protein